MRARYTIGCEAARLGLQIESDELVVADGVDLIGSFVEVEFMDVHRRFQLAGEFIFRVSTKTKTPASNSRLQATQAIRCIITRQKK